METQPDHISSSSTTSSADLDSLSGQMKEVRLAASSLLARAEAGSSVTDFAAAVEKAAQALKLAVEMEKTRKELVKLSDEIANLQYTNKIAPKRARSEQIRDYVALLTPLVTIITLGATLVAQNWQFLRSEQDRREDAMDTQWHDAVKTISASGALSPGVIALQPFLRSMKYGDQARDAAVNLLSNSSDPGFFTSLFGTALVPVTGPNLDRVIRLDRALLARVEPIWNKTWNEKEERDDSTKLSKEELATFNYMNYAFPVITSEVGSAMKIQTPGNRQIDISACFFKNGEWQGINLSGANLVNSRLIWMNLQNAELEAVTQFSGAVLYRTAWWEAKSINRLFLDYLLATYPFKPGAAYGPHDISVKQDEYDHAIQRLNAQLDAGRKG